MYAYNGEGTRVKKVNTDGTETYFFYDGANAVMEYDSGGNATAKYWHGPDGLVWMNKSATNMYVGCDHLGSVWNTVTLDASETIKATYTYTAFGNTTASEVIPNNYRYVGKLGYYNDPESGMMLLGHRYYNPSVGRFLTIDPIRDGENWYAYVDGQPLSHIDPSGLGECESQAWKNFYQCLQDFLGIGLYTDIILFLGCLVVCAIAAIVGTAGILIGGCFPLCGLAVLGWTGIVIVVALTICIRQLLVALDACKPYNPCPPGDPENVPGLGPR